MDIFKNNPKEKPLRWQKRHLICIIQLSIRVLSPPPWPGPSCSPSRNAMKTEVGTSETAHPWLFEANSHGNQNDRRCKAGRKSTK